MVYQITLTRRGVQFDIALRAPSRMDAMRVVMNAATRHDAEEGCETKVLRIVETTELEFLLEPLPDEGPGSS